MMLFLKQLIKELQNGQLKRLDSKCLREDLAGGFLEHVMQPG
jgi:hypothetical protein